MISLIAAMDRNRNIGLNGDMPWGKEMKADLKRFKDLTDGKTIIMGRKTFESLPCYPYGLPNRKNIIITRQDYTLKGDMIQTFDDIGDVLDYAAGEEEVFVIGGAQIYEQFLPYADKIYITKVLAHLEGDTKFPEIQGNWKINQEPPEHIDGDIYPSQYITFERA
jgi:dihydrofolate reductase